MMGTNCALFIRDGEEWLAYRCHYDGDPGTMMPALVSVNPTAIVAAREIRCIDDFGTVEPVSGPSDPVRMPAPRKMSYAAYSYILTERGWRQARTEADFHELASKEGSDHDA